MITSPFDFYWKHYDEDFYWHRYDEEKDPIEFNKQRCLHDSCPNCHGTGRDSFGHICVHALSCPCPRCSPICM